MSNLENDAKQAALNAKNQMRAGIAASPIKAMLIVSGVVAVIIIGLFVLKVL